MYVFISFIYFFLLATLPNENENKSIIKITNDGKEIDYKSPDLKSIGDTLETREHYDSIQKALPLEDRDGWFKRKWKYRELELNKQFKGNPSQFIKHVVETFVANFSTVFFFLLPVFALILWLLYIRKDFFYSEHLVFSICYYNFFYLAGSLSMLAETVSWLKWISLLLDLVILIYLLLALKRTYSQGWGKTTVKFVGFVSVFGICIIFGLLINLFVTLMIV